jgi:nucleolar complex protein 2
LQGDDDDGDGDDSEIDKDENSDQDENDDVGGSQSTYRKSLRNVDESFVRELLHSADEGSLTSFKKILAIFRVTCLPRSDGADDSWTDMAGAGFTVTSPEVYEFVMIEVLDRAHTIFFNLLDMPVDKTPSRQKLESMTNHPRWKKVQMFVLSFYKSVLHTLASLSTQIKETDLSSDVTRNTDKSSRGGKGAPSDPPASSGASHVAAYLLSCLSPYIALLYPMQRLAKGVIKVCLRLWSHGPSPDQDLANVRGQAFLRLRQMALTLPSTVTEECFRAAYLAYARSAKSFSEQSAPSVVFMSQCITELYKLDVAHAYQQVFMFD